MIHEANNIITFGKTLPNPGTHEYACTNKQACLTDSVSVEIPQVPLIAFTTLGKRIMGRERSKKEMDGTNI